MAGLLPQQDGQGWSSRFRDREAGCLAKATQPSKPGLPTSGPARAPPPRRRQPEALGCPPGLRHWRGGRAEAGGRGRGASALRRRPPHSQSVLTQLRGPEREKSAERSPKPSPPTHLSSAFTLVAAFPPQAKPNFRRPPPGTSQRCCLFIGWKSCPLTETGPRPPARYCACAHLFSPTLRRPPSRNLTAWRGGGRLKCGGTSTFCQ